MGETLTTALGLAMLVPANQSIIYSQIMGQFLQLKVLIQKHSEIKNFDQLDGFLVQIDHWLVHLPLDSEMAGARAVTWETVGVRVRNDSCRMT